MSNNNITGDAIKTKLGTKEEREQYAENFDKIFGKKEKEKEEPYWKKHYQENKNVRCDLTIDRINIKYDSDWVCYLFGGTSGDGIHYRPRKGHEPNCFVRWMMKICFNCTWVKDK